MKNYNHVIIVALNAENAKIKPTLAQIAMNLECRPITQTDNAFVHLNFMMTELIKIVNHVHIIA